MAWYAIYRISDSSLYSVGEVNPDSLPEGYAVKELPPACPNFSFQQWNSETLEFDPLPKQEPEPEPDLDAATAVLEQLGVVPATAAIQSTGAAIQVEKIPPVEADPMQQILTLLTFLVQKEIVRG